MRPRIWATGALGVLIVVSNGSNRVRLFRCPTIISSIPVILRVIPPLRLRVMMVNVRLTLVAMLLEATRPWLLMNTRLALIPVPGKFPTRCLAQR